MNWDVSQFHFIRPLWLLALPALILLWWSLSKVLKPTHWERHIAQHLLEALKVTGGKQTNQARGWLLLLWTVACLAMAGPTWQKIAVPTVQNQNALVIVFDLSRSMLAQDLSPNRLSQARFKLIDVLRQRQDGQTALIAYAGDAHTVSPLTDDPKSIEALLSALHPNIMPSQGSNTESAIELASQLLNDAGVYAGDILLMTDGVAPEAQTTISKALPSTHRLSILGVGSDNPTPIPLQGGGFLRNSNSEIVLSSLNQNELRKLASNNGGRYAQWQVNNGDTQYLVQPDINMSDALNNNTQDSNTVFDSWADMSYWLVLLLLPIVALSFRKGLVYCLPLVLLPSLLTPNNAHAFGWNDLWQTKDQQAAKLIEQDQAQQAATTFESDDWRAVANYKAGNYAEATAQFDAEGPNSRYNQGNALALQGDLKGAVAAYEKALKTNPDHDDAKHNKDIVEQLLKQQEQQDQNQDNSEKGDSEDQQQEQEDQAKENSEQSNSEESDSNTTESEQESAENSESEDSDNKKEESQQDDSAEPNKDSPEGKSDEEKAQEKKAAEEQDSEEPSSEEQSEENAQQATETNESADDESDKSDKSDESESQASEQMSAEATPEQLKDSSEQWLRRIQDDPSGLLRRKFEYQTQQRAQQGSSFNQQRQNNKQTASPRGSERY